jgi:hypothetical protein
MADEPDKAGKPKKGAAKIPKLRPPNGQEMTTDVDVSDVEFIQSLIALNYKITGEINQLAMNLLTGADARKNVEPLNRLKAAVDELHAILSSARVAKPKQ